MGVTVVVVNAAPEVRSKAQVTVMWRNTAIFACIYVYLYVCVLRVQQDDCWIRLYDENVITSSLARQQSDFFKAAAAVRVRERRIRLGKI